jgi:HSP20 family protein
VRLLAGQLNAASGSGAFDELLLVAPPRALSELREALEAGSQANLVGTREKDLVKTPDHELWPHVREWFSSCAASGRLICINAAGRTSSQLVAPVGSTTIGWRLSMANSPVEVKKTAPAPAGAPDAWRSFRTEMDRLFDRFASGWGMPSLRRMLDVEPSFRSESSFSVPSPAVDISEDDKAYKVTAELPGMSEKEIEVVVSGDTLTLKGEKRQEKEQKEKNYYLSERSYGSFPRSFYLPEGVDRGKIGAEFSQGVLTVTMPKTEKAVQQQKKIEVKGAG